jgi:hypothetical protein
LKRPVLLQTHPGIWAVRLQTHDWLLGTGGRRSDDGRRKRTSWSKTASAPSLKERAFSEPAPFSPSGPRPNALPLHNVRNPKDGGRTTEDGSSSLPALRPSLRPSAQSARAKLIKHASEGYDEGGGRYAGEGIIPNGLSRAPSVILFSVARLVEPDGIEPTTSCLQSTRSPN